MKNKPSTPKGPRTLFNLKGKRVRGEGERPKPFQPREKPAPASSGPAFPVPVQHQLVDLPFELLTHLPGKTVTPWLPLGSTAKFSWVYGFKDLVPDLYDLVPYHAINVLGTPLFAYVIYPQGVRPAVTQKTLAEVEARNNLQLGLVLCSRTAALHSSVGHVMLGTPSRINTLNLVNIQPDTLEKNGVEVKLLLRSDRFVVFHATNTFTLFTITSIPERLEGVLTSV